MDGVHVKNNLDAVYVVLRTPEVIEMAFIVFMSTKSLLRLPGHIVQYSFVISLHEIGLRVDSDLRAPLHRSASFIPPSKSRSTTSMRPVGVRTTSA